MTIHLRAAILAGLLALAAVGPAAAQNFEPRSGRSYLVRDLHGQLMERLRPTAGGYVRYDIRGQRLGRAVPGNGGQLTFYDTSGARIAVAQRNGRPPAALRLNAVAVIRGTGGETLGVVALR